MKQWVYVWLLGLVVLLAALLRLYHLDQYPPSLNWDEVSHGYNAWAIWKTGADEWGIRVPLVFRAFGDFKLPVYIYSLVPWVAIGGLNAWTVRLSSALAGIMSVGLTYGLVVQIGTVQRLLGRGKTIGWQRVGLLAAFMVAVAPWTIFLSRMAVEANLASMLFIAAVYFFHLGLAQKLRGEGKAWAFLMAGLMAGLTLFTYNSFRIFTPMMTVAAVLVYAPAWEWQLFNRWWKRLRLPKRFGYEPEKLACSCHLIGLAVFLLFFMMTSYQLMYTNAGQARAANIAVLDQGMINRINEARGTSELPTLVTRLIHNKLTYVAVVSGKNYMSFFNPNFWYVSGGHHYQFSGPGMYLLPTVNLLFVVFGLAWLWKWPRPSLWFVIGWILLAPLPASPTRDNPHTLRIITMLPMMQVVTAWGLYQTVKWVQTKFSKDRKQIISGILYGIYMVIVLGYLGNFMKVYTGTYASEYAWAWQSGSKEMVEYVMAHYQTAPVIYVTKYYGEPHAFVQFYSQWDVRDNQQNRVWEYRDAGTSVAWYWVNGLGKIRFINDWEIGDITPVAGAVVLSQPQNPYDSQPESTISDQFGRVIYNIDTIDNTDLN